MARGHNSADDKLKSLVERIERLEEEKAAIGDDVKAIYAEAKAIGYQPAIMKVIVRLRKMDPIKRREMEEMIAEYKSALGLDLV